MKATELRRRQVLVGLGCGLGALALEACGGLPSTPTPTPTPLESVADQRVAKLLATLEYSLVSVYQQITQTITRRSLGHLQPGIGDVVTTVLKHHQMHLQQWNAALSLAYVAPAGSVDAAIQSALDRAGKARDAASVIAALASLETVAVETYAARTGDIVDAGYRHLSAAIGPVEAQHVSVLALLGGQAATSTLPWSTVPTSLARPTSDVV